MIARHAVRAIPLGLIMLACLWGCSADKPSIPDGGGYGDAVVAVYANSVLDDENLHGSVILINEDGEFRVRATEGLYIGEAVATDRGLYFSDQSADTTMTSDRSTSSDRSDENLMYEWSGEAGNAFVTVFNSGLKGTDDYFSDVIIRQDDGAVATGSIRGDLRGITSCDGSVFGLVGSWANPDGFKSPRLLRLDVANASVETVEVGKVRAKGPNQEYYATTCLDNMIVTLAASGRRTWLGTVEPATAQTTWKPVTDNGQPVRSVGADRQVLVGDQLVSIDRETRALITIDAHSGERANRGKIAPHDFVTYAASGDELLVLSSENGDYAVRWYSPSNAKVVREIHVASLGDYLRDHNEMVGDPKHLTPDEADG